MHRPDKQFQLLQVIGDAHDLAERIIEASGVEGFNLKFIFGSFLDAKVIWIQDMDFILDEEEECRLRIIVRQLPPII